MPTKKRSSAVARKRGGEPKQRTSSRCVLEQLGVYCLPGQLDVTDDTPPDEGVLDRRLLAGAAAERGQLTTLDPTSSTQGSRADHVRVPLEVEHANRVESDVEELVDRLERASDAEVVLELDRNLCGAGERRRSATSYRECKGWRAHPGRSAS